MDENKTIMSLMNDEKSFKEFKNDLQTLLELFKSKYDLNTKIGKYTYTENSISVNIAFNKATYGGFDTENFLNNFKNIYGLKLEHLYAKFMYKNSVFEIIGINENSKKYPIKAKSGNKILYFNSGILNNLIEEL